MQKAAGRIVGAIVVLVAVLVAGCYVSTGGWRLTVQPITITVVDLERNEPVLGAVVCARWFTLSPSIHGERLGREIRHAEGVTDRWGQVTLSGATVRRSGWEVLRNAPLTFAYKTGYVSTTNPRESFSASVRYVRAAKSHQDTAAEVRFILEDQSDAPYSWHLTKFPRLRRELLESRPQPAR